MLRDYFVAPDEDGKEQGLASRIADEIIQPLRQVIGLMAAQSNELISMYHSALPTGVVSKQTIVSILTHRTDKIAVAFVKNPPT